MQQNNEAFKKALEGHPDPTKAIEAVIGRELEESITDQQDVPRETADKVADQHDLRITYNEKTKVLSGLTKDGQRTEICVIIGWSKEERRTSAAILATALRLYHSQTAGKGGK